MSTTIALFDLGSTLLYTRSPWEPIQKRGDEALALSLHNSGIHINSDSFVSEFGGFISTYYADQAKTRDFLEKTSLVALQEILASKGFPDTSQGVLRTALDAMYAITQKNWQLEEDALLTFEKLKENGIRLGLISNTSDDKNVQQLIDHWNIRHYFDFIITSAGFGIRKPDGRIFQAALDFFQTSPANSVMVGDSLEADILGANGKGIYSILINRRVNVDQELLNKIQPSAVVSRLSQIPDLLFESNRYG